MGELIDRQETLDALDKRFESLLKRFDYNSYENADEKTKLVCDGLSEAEDVVMGLPSALSTNLAEVGTDCISRQQAIDRAVKFELFGEKVKFVAVSEIVKLPPVQPDLSEYSDKLWQKAYERGKAEAQAEIVRCKDCRFNTYSKKCLNPDSFFLVPADDFYCGYAERRTDE